MDQGTECCAGLRARFPPGLFKALSDPNRIAILVRLAEGADEQTVKELACCCPVDMSVVSRHLQTLREAGVVSAEKRGKEVFHRLQVRELAGALRGLADALDSCCPENPPESG